ncbi:NUDIX domain-containing protein [Aquimarina algicola]|uniref:GDP-mannose pyrophosphatase n=1 Tax=Aquimarina algicola TaxID=2589995 RepID=A0A504JMT1_9FLAO|nr:NUDIX hydrolase [Aquimarina algicola]TPN88993.1 NUDIX hydrolase [Aquimarina algicola]
MKYKIDKENLVYEGFLKIKKATITHDRFHNENTISYSREMLDKGDCVAVLLFEKDTQNVLLINQFRYPTTQRDNDGWLVELPAGGIEKDEDPVTCAIREVEEETGYRASQLQLISKFYATPGVSSERMYLYYAEVTSNDKIAEGGGVKEENEDIQLCKYPISEIDSLLNNSKINDAKTIIALQWFLLHK